MTNPTPHGQVPEALRLAEAITNMICSSETAAKTIAAAADELCRLHVENAALRTAHVQNPAEIEHVAGGVSKNGVEVNMTRAQVDAIVYACRQAGDDSTYAVVNAALRTPQAADSVLEDVALLRARHEFLRWNRSLQPSPIESSVECSVFDKALELYDTARKQGGA